VSVTSRCFIKTDGRIKQLFLRPIHSAAGSGTVQSHQSKQIQTNVIKTMILVSVLFGVTSTPVSVYTLLMNIHVTVMNIQQQKVNTD